jgi:hypothetical protein
MARDALNGLRLVRLRQVGVSLDYLEALPTAEFLHSPQSTPAITSREAEVWRSV